ncbi:hypothetical protein [Streptomyces sp. NPDC021969]
MAENVPSWMRSALVAVVLDRQQGAPVLAAVPASELGPWEIAQS